MLAIQERPAGSTPLRYQSGSAQLGETSVPLLRSYTVPLSFDIGCESTGERRRGDGEMDGTL